MPLLALGINNTKTAPSIRHLIYILLDHLVCEALLRYLCHSAMGFLSRIPFFFVNVIITGRCMLLWRVENFDRQPAGFLTLLSLCHH